MEYIFKTILYKWNCICDFEMWISLCGLFVTQFTNHKHYIYLHHLRSFLYARL